MYSYKLNNSYTIYVNYIYLNECIKASKKKAKSHKSSKSTKHQSIIKNENVTKPKNPKPRFTPLSHSTGLIHKTFGFGRVLTTDKNGIMQVAFADKIVKFVYPDAVNQGYLSLA